MRRAFLFVCAVIAMSVGIAGCSHSGKIIGSSDMAEIYARMLVADQWLRTNGEYRKTADTTLFYEPIFREFGYTTADYDRSVHYYLDKPEKYIKLLRATMEILNKRESELLAAQDEEDRIKAANAAIKGYAPKDFNLDSLRYAAPGILWRRLSLDSLSLDSLHLDSLRRDSLRLDSLRLDSLRADSIARAARPVKAKKGHLDMRVEAPSK